jgi:hypothetical protein
METGTTGRSGTTAGASAPSHLDASRPTASRSAAIPKTSCATCVIADLIHPADQAVPPGTLILRLTLRYEDSVIEHHRYPRVDASHRHGSPVIRNRI